MKIPRGLKLKDTSDGTGRHALPGDTVRFEYECRLNRGELIGDSSEYGPCQYRLGSRDCSPGIEFGLMGMRAGGERQIKVPPHLAYIDRQSSPEIPEDAVVHYTIRLIEIVDPPWDPDMATRLNCSGLRMSG